jgi:NAD(P)-dependent dehydrogenase (short-subunit alcohol dehydrogenase family)
MRLAGRVTIITGAAQGIGAAVARECAKEGASVMALDIKPEVKDVCDQIVAAGGKASGYVLNIADTAAYQTCVEQIAAQEGRIDALVNNAVTCSYADILHDSLEEWRRMHQVNLEAVYWGCKLVAPYMAKQKRGWIVNVSSIQAFMTDGNAGAYCAAKGAIISFTKSLAIELAPYGVLANAIAPGAIHTPLSMVNGVDETTTPIFQEWYVGKRKIPLARAGEPEEIAKVAVFLVSDDCSYMTGSTVVVDGGLSSTF